MEKPLKEYLAEQMIGKRFRFTCNCIVNMNLVGTIKDYDIVSNEIVFIVESNEKIIRIGENHPNLKISSI